MDIGHEQELRERVNGILQDGAEDIAPEDVLDCVVGSASFKLNFEERKFVLDQVKAIVGR